MNIVIALIVTQCKDIIYISTGLLISEVPVWSIGDVMVSGLVSSAVGRGFDPQTDQSRLSQLYVLLLGYDRIQDMRPSDYPRTVVAVG